MAVMVDVRVGRTRGNRTDSDTCTEPLPRGDTPPHHVGQHTLAVPRILYVLHRCTTFLRDNRIGMLSDTDGQVAPQT